MTRTARMTKVLAGSAIAVIVGLLVLLSAIRRAPETYPWGDTAATSIYTLRAATDGLSVGAYSRFQWNHPGPLLYQSLAPLYAASGYREVSIKWTAWTINMGALVALIAVVWRRAPTLAATVALALMPLLYREQRLLFWAWNPMLPILPMSLAVALSAGVAAGRAGLLPWLVLVASFVTQAHVGFAPAIAIMFLIAVAGLIRRGRSGVAPYSRRHILIAGAVLVAVWAVPVLHEIRARPGNLSSIVAFFLTPAGVVHPWSTVLTVFANQLVGPFVPSWEVTTAEASHALSWPVLVSAFVQFPLLVIATIRAARRSAFFEAAFALICLAVSLVGTFSVRAIVGPISDYLITWVAAIGALNVAVIGAEVAHALRVFPGTARKPLQVALIAYLIAIGIMGGVRLTAKHAADARSEVVRTLSDRLAEYCREQRIERPMLRFSLAGWEGASGMLLHAYKHDRPIAVPDDLRYYVGDPFAATGREAGEFYLMLSSEAEIPPGVTRHEWLITHGPFRLIRLFR